MNSKLLLVIKGESIQYARADLEVQLMQQNHCDGVLSNDWNTLLGQQISQHAAMAMSMSRSALDTIDITLNLYRHVTSPSIAVII